MLPVEGLRDPLSPLLGDGGQIRHGLAGTLEPHQLEAVMGHVFRVKSLGIGKGMDKMSFSAPTALSAFTCAVMLEVTVTPIASSVFRMVSSSPS